MRHRIAAALYLVLLSSAGSPAHGDGGTLRAWQRSAGHDVAVFTDPTPVSIGPLDVSVLVLDPETGQPIECGVTVEITPRGRSGRVLRRTATTEAATNKLLRAAPFDLELSGPCRVLVDVAGPKGRARVEFELDVAPASYPHSNLWPWILWPVPVIALFAVHRLLVGRKGRIQEVGVPACRRPRPSTPGSSGE